MLAEELEVEEWAALDRAVVEDDVDTLVLGNETGQPVDEAALGERLAGIDGVERVRSLVVGADSRVRNLEFLAALPHLATVDVYGLRLESLAGLPRDSGWDFVKVDTGRNRKRSLAALAGTPIQRLSVRWGNEHDLAAVGGATGVVDLELRTWPELPLAELRDLPLEFLALVSGRLEELAGTGAVPSLRELRLVDCRSVRRLTGDNRNLTRLVIRSCNQLDLATVASCPDLTTVDISAQRQPVQLGVFQGLARLRQLSIDDSRVEVDVADLKRSAPRLVEIAVSGLRASGLRELSLANRGVTVTNGLAAFRDGLPADASDEQGWTHDATSG